jgi:hypothetical protein
VRGETFVPMLDREERRRFSALSHGTRQGVARLLWRFRAVRPDLNRPGDYGDLLSALERWDRTEEGRGG